MVELIAKGGPLVWVLLASSILAFGIFLERLFYYHRSSVDVSEMLHGLTNLVRRKKFAEAKHECVLTPGPVARVIHSCLRRHHASRDDLRQIAQEAGQLEVPRLERYLRVLTAIATIAPIIGLLGTLIGLMLTFEAITAVSGMATPTDISRGVYQSLITSALGMAIAIPSYLFHAFLSASAQSIMHDMERAGIEIVNIICDARDEPDSRIVEFEGDESVRGPAAEREG
jgi:biopolymer transport protein ExbB